MHDRARVPGVLIGLALLTACGGGAPRGDGLSLLDPTPPSGFVTEIMPTVARATGYVTQPAILAAPASPAVGDSEANRPQRGFFRFDLQGLPAGIEVESAVLQIRQRAVLGHPYDELGPLFVEDVNLGLELDPDDFGALVPSSAIGVLAVDPAIGIQALDVTQKVRRDVALGRPASDFRLFFNIATDLDGEPDLAILEAGPGDPPGGLVITYRR